MRKIVVLNYKGGVGKTVTTLNVGYNLSEQGYRVLIVDADPQGNSSAFFEKYDVTKKSLTDVLTEKASIQGAIKRTKFKNLDILPSNLSLERIQEVKKEVLFYKLELVKDKYDFVLIDCPPNFQMNTVNALVAADDVIIPVKVDRFCVDGLSSVVEQVESAKMNYHIPISNIRYFINMYQRTKGINMGVMDILKKYDYDRFNTVVRKSAAVDYSTYRRKPLKKCGSTSTTCEDFINLTQEIINMAEEG